MNTILRIVRHLPFVSSYLQSKSLYRLQQRQARRYSILSLYRYFNKTIPKLYTRQIQKVNKLEQLKFIFKSSKPLINEKQIKMKLSLAQGVRQKLQTQQWKSLPQYEIQLNNRKQKDLQALIKLQSNQYIDQNRTKHKVKW